MQYCGIISGNTAHSNKETPIIKCLLVVQPGSISSQQQYAYEYKTLASTSFFSCSHSWCSSWIQPLHFRCHPHPIRLASSRSSFCGQSSPSSPAMQNTLNPKHLLRTKLRLTFTKLAGKIARTARTLNYVSSACPTKSNNEVNSDTLKSVNITLPSKATGN